MQLKALYRARFTQNPSWSVSLSGVNGTENRYFMLGQGRCEGRIVGGFRSANHPRRRTDETFVPDVQGVIETDDGAVILFDYQGYGRAYPIGRRQVVLAATHFSEDERYRWLNDVVCVGVGEARSEPNEIVLEVAELIWEPIAD